MARRGSAMISEFVAARYRIIAKLGGGGSAEVFEAVPFEAGRRESLPRVAETLASESRGAERVALKVLRLEFSGRQEQRTAFLSELRALAALQHPGIPFVFDGGEYSDPERPELTPTAWIAMELVRGITLSAAVAANGRLAPKLARVVADALLDAAAAVHENGLVHRDITPANVMLDPEALIRADALALRRSVRLIDFGIADLSGRSVRGSDPLLSGLDASEAGVVASVRYASPEQLRGGPVTARSDVYQLAGTILFALTGSPPFSGDARSVTQAQLRERPPIASERVPGLPSEVDRFILGGLVKSPAERYPDAAAMRAALPPPSSFALSTPAQRPATTTIVPWRPEDAERTVVLSPSVNGAPRVRRGGRGQRSTRRTTSGAANSSGGTVAAMLIALGFVAALVAFAVASQPAAKAERTAAAPRTASASPTSTATPRATARPRLFRVPEVVGQTVDEARATLRAAGLVVGQLLLVDAPKPAGSVLSASPVPGTAAAPGSAVVLQVASGRNAVPAVAGLDTAAASAALQAAGFTVQLDGDGVSIASALALGTDPAALTVVDVGSTVTLHTVASPLASPSATPTASPTPTVPRSASPTPTPMPMPTPTPSPTHTR